jgi:hypothetical protein
MTEDTALKILRDALSEAIKTGMPVTVVGYRLNVVVAPNTPAGASGAGFYLHDRSVSLTAAVAAMAESTTNLTV